MKKRAHISFSGTVQGVGFRYITRHAANNYGLTGWVRNCTDGSVEIVVEGEENTIELLLSSLNDHFDGYIRNTETNWTEARNDFETFDVRI